MGKRTNSAVWFEKYSRWQINVQKDGRRRSFTSSKPGRTGQREANAKADEWLDKGVDGGNARVDAVLDEYFFQRKGTVAPETHQRELSICEIWIKPYIGHKKLDKLTEGDLQNILDQAAKKGVAKKTGLNKKSISNIMGIAKRFLKHCRKNKLTTLNPEFLEVPRSAPKNDRRILQPEHLQILFSCDNVALWGNALFDRYVYAFRFSVLTGLRPGELLGLRWSDLNGDTLTVRRAINNSGRETKGKNDNARRSFVLGEMAALVLKNQREISTTDSIFEIESQSTYRHRWLKYCQFNNIPYISPYEMRHTFVSVAKNLPDGELRQVVGHSKSMDTYGIYSHEMQDDKKKISRNLNKIWNDILAPKK